MFSIVLVYLLIVVNFQSWLDPFIIFPPCPPHSPALLVLVPHAYHRQRTRADGSHHVHGRCDRQQHPRREFATETVAEGSIVSAALEAGFTRFRPVLMTALAMISAWFPWLWDWEKAANRMPPRPG